MLRHAPQLRTPVAPTRSTRRASPGGSGRVLELQRTIGNRRTTRLIQREVHPLDVASELVGRWFTLTRKVTAGGVEWPAGEFVQVHSWVNGSPTVKVVPFANGRTVAAIDVPKKLLRHAEGGAAGIVEYSVGLDEVVRHYERGEQQLVKERARKGGARADEITRLEGEQANRQRRLDERLIQETMFNRFDSSIKKWVDHYNAKLGYTGAKALDPDLVKAMLYEETQMGTEGKHLDVPATNIIRNRFNIGQGTIDSGAITMVHILREDDPALFARYKLQDIEKHMSDAQDELARLEKLASPTDVQKAQIDRLKFLSGPGDSGNWENFLWNYVGPGQTKKLYDAVADFFDDAPGTPRNLDYDFWIQGMVRLLFLKRKGQRTWEESVRAFNGSGPKARAYRDRVMDRYRNVKAAGKQKQRYLADKI